MRLGIFCATGLAALGLATSAGAAPRYASPAGTPADDCSSGRPCDFVTAVNGAVDNTEVIVAPGDYGSAASPVTSFSTSSDVDVHGPVGGPRPRVFFTGQSGLTMTSAQATLRDVDISNVDTDPSATDHVALWFEGSVAERVAASSAARYGTACRLGADAVLRDSVCWAPGGGTALSVFNDKPTASPTVVSSTLWAPTPSGVGAAVQSTGGHSATLHIRDSIVRAHGGPNDNPDLTVYATNGGTTQKITVDHSNYGSAKVIGTDGTGEITEDLNTKQSAAPMLANPGTGDFHELALSPTVGAGVADANTGTLDLDGNPRAVDGRIDLGADELFVAPRAATGPASPVSRSGATLTGTVGPNATTTSYRFEYGTTPAYGTPTAAVAAGAGTGDVPAAAAVTGLAAGRTYHFHLVATNAAGSADGGDSTFTTAVARSVLSALRVVPNAFLAAASGASATAATGTTISYRASESGTTRFTVQRPASGRRSRGRCVRPARGLRNRPRCIRWITLRGSFSHVDVAGANRLHFTGRLRGRRLAPGRYRLAARSSNAAGAGQAVYRTFRVRPPRRAV
ncbi:MAG: hypothetical protein QOE65_2911 [Solirubrobacteraceae bacterium]|jgi:hypothetical protein|nr:hypothetical protein [Solirubrobacteraceae bacterium]